MKKIWEVIKSTEFQKFFISGSSAFLVDTSLVIILLSIPVFTKNDIFDIQITDNFKFKFSVVKFLSACVAVTFSFILNRYWAFKAKHEKVSIQVLKFSGVFFFNVLVASLVFPVYRTILLEVDIFNLGIKTISSIANILTTSNIMLISFFFYKFVVFKKPKI